MAPDYNPKKLSARISRHFRHK